MNPLLPLVTQTRSAQRELANAPAAQRSKALVHLADVLNERQDAILAANQRDLDLAQEAQIAEPLISRLRLSPAKLNTLADGLNALAHSDDPIGKAMRRTTLDDGLELRQVMSPIGVLLVIFESRPDAVIQIGSLALRSGNGVILKGGSEAAASNQILVQCIQESLNRSNLNPLSVQGVADRASIAALLELEHAIDLVIPRGSGELVKHIQSNTRIPVLGHAEGVCMLYIDSDADPEMAAKIAVDGKCDYPSACNATETILVHRAWLPHLSKVASALQDAGVQIRADETSRAQIRHAIVANDSDGATEYGDLILTIRVVDSVEKAIDYIHQNGSGHTESIVTDNQRVAQQFLQCVDSASVFHNASTRFADGYRYGLGAEVGISTGKIHARGPVGVEGLMTTRWLLRGQGHCAADFGPNGRRFLHRHEPLN